MICSVEGLVGSVHRTACDAGLYVQGSIVHDLPIAGVRLIVDGSSIPARIGVPPITPAGHGPGQRTAFRAAVGLAGWLPASWADRSLLVELQVWDYDGRAHAFGQLPVSVPPHRPATSPPPPATMTSPPSSGAHRKVQVFLHRQGRGGAESWAARLVDGLRRRGRVTIMAELLPPVCPTSPSLDGLWHHADERSFAAQVGAADQLIAVAEPELVLCNTLECLAAAEAARRRGTPFVWAIHESYSPGSLWASVFGLRPAIPTMVDALDSCLRGAHGLLFVSNETVQPYLATSGDAPVHVVPFAVDPNVTARRRPAREPLGSDVRALALGTLEERKNLTPLVSALAHARRISPGLRLTIAGPGDPVYLDHLRTTIARLGQRDAVQLLAHHVDAADALSIADLLVSASDVESRSTVVLEAWRAGVPVLAAAATGMRELIDEGVDGVLVPVGDYRAFAEAWVALAARPDVREQVAAAGGVSFDREASRPWVRLVESVLTDERGRA